MHRGFTKRWRKRWDKGYHLDSELWLLMDYFIDFANYKDSEVYIKYCGLVPLKRGQHLFGTSQLSGFLGWPAGLVRRKILILKNIGFLTIRTTNRYSIATVINYNTYQPSDRNTTSKRQAERQAERQATDQQNDKQPTTPKEYKEYKERKEKGFPDYENIIRETISYLNQQAGVKFNPATYATQTIIIDRINEGATLADFKAVITKKVSQWLSDEKMAGNLAPTTLFAADKFEKYLQEASRSGGKKPKAPTLTGIQLLGMGFDVLKNFGQEKFNEFCKLNELSKDDIYSIQDRFDHETAVK